MWITDALTRTLRRAAVYDAQYRMRYIQTVGSSITQKFDRSRFKDAYLGISAHAVRLIVSNKETNHLDITEMDVKQSKR